MSAPARHPSLRSLVRRWRDDRRGVTVIEFAMLAAPTIFMIMALIELAVYFMVQVTLDSATAEAARELRTGSYANGQPAVADGVQDTQGQQAFINNVCSNMSWLAGACAANIIVDVRPLSSFSSSPGSVSNGVCFYSGSAGSAIELRTYYNWKLLTGVLNAAFQAPNASPGVTQLESADVFQVEPNGQTNPSQTQC